MMSFCLTREHQELAESTRDRDRFLYWKCREFLLHLIGKDLGGFLHILEWISLDTDWSISVMCVCLNREHGNLTHFPHLHNLSQELGLPDRLGLHRQRTMS